MSRQDFTTADRLRLEVEAAPPEPRNGLENPDGELGGYGWESPTVGDTVAGYYVAPDDYRLTFAIGPAGATVDHHFYSEVAPIAGGLERAYVGFVEAGSDRAGINRLTFRVEYLDAAGALVEAAPDRARDLGATSQTWVFVGTSAPAAATGVRLRITPSLTGARPAAGSYVRVNGVNLGISALGGASTPYIPARTYLDVLGSSLDLRLNRRGLELGLLTGTVLAPDLDPAVSDALAPGRRARLLVLDDAGTWRPAITAELGDVVVEYRLRHPDPAKRTRITLTATDAVRRLAAVKRPDGVETVDELRLLLEGGGVPWSVNGANGQHPGPGTVVARNDNATLLDQLAITRDTAGAIVYVDPTGRVQAWDPAAGRPDPTVATITGAYLDDVDVAYDTAAIVNEVSYRVLSLDPVTGETVEALRGPYRDAGSVRRWGAHPVTYTVQLADPDVDLEPRAREILAANATPTRRVRSLTARVLEAGDFIYEPGANRHRKALLDLYDKVYLDLPAAGVAGYARVHGIEHTITPKRWEVRVDLVDADTVAGPLVTPDPPPATTTTLAQLLRPVGEVTDYYGLPANLWPGWRLLDGSAVGDEPELLDWLTLNGLPTDVLPDARDRIAVGAGVKAVGATSGQWAKVLTVAQLPAHDHGAGTLGAGSAGGHKHSVTRSTATGSGAQLARGTAAADVVNDNPVGTDGAHTHNVTGTTGTTGTGAPLDVTPPVVAFYKVIRARSGA